jgi:hypothetical protein
MVLCPLCPLRYDVRKKCDREGEDGPLCYRQMGWIEEYLNQEDVKRELGVSPELEFKSCNMQVSLGRPIERTTPLLSIS